MSEQIIEVVWNEDATNTVIGRITARDGTGTATGVAGEGKWLKQADISTITCKVIDEETETTIITPTVTISSAVIDTPVTATTIWTADGTDNVTGYNFMFDIPPTGFPTGGKIVRAEFKVTTTGSAVHWLRYRGPVSGVLTS